MTTIAEQPCLFRGNLLLPRDGAWPFGSLEPMSYDVLMVDPPWHFELYSEKGESKSANAQYRTMSQDDIRTLPVGALAKPNAMLWLWVTWPLLPFALECLKTWGFEYKTGGAWDKQRWGTGYLMRSVCEPFLIGTSGNPKIRGTSIPNLIEESRREHSRKPEESYRMAEMMVPSARRIEIFSRCKRVGWDTWGDEADKYASPPLPLEDAAK
jgi:N6-adenosine-specific RNA methylase IME4